MRATGARAAVQTTTHSEGLGWACTAVTKGEPRSFCVGVEKAGGPRLSFDRVAVV